MSSVFGESSTPKRVDELPQTFNVRYLGFREAKGLWGIKHTRKPVDELVSAAKEAESAKLHIIKLIISNEGCKLESVYRDKLETRFFPIETISYGVQDLVYTRVFAIIVVKESPPEFPYMCPFECHAFVCDSKQSARTLTYDLASAFQDYSRRLKATGKAELSNKKPFAIDLRTPEEMRSEFRYHDSEA